MGPLHGYRIVELGAIGPGPFCAMMLADMGADVIRLDRHEAADLGLKRETRFATLNRGRKSVAINLKSPGAAAVVMRLVRSADGLIEGFRPGVTERLGLGPDACLREIQGWFMGELRAGASRDPSRKTLVTTSTIWRFPARCTESDEKARRPPHLRTC